MIGYEMKKLFIKQKGLFLLIAVFIIQAITAVSSYHKNTFSDSQAEAQYYTYMEHFAGKFSREKKAEIEAEQLVIIDARNENGVIDAKLRNGKYAGREEYLADYEKIRPAMAKQEPFSLLFTRYSHALENPDNRYIISGNYDGMTVDFSDFPFLLLIVFSASILFLGEESSNMITFLRISENGRGKTLFAKLFSICVLIVSGFLFRLAAEFVMLNVTGSFNELFYPFQSIEYFDGCPFEMTILEGFFAINLLKLLGYFFISALAVILAITLKKALLTVFIPFALCVLQQFAFIPAVLAYYIPTGLVRAVDYFRGEYQTNTYPYEIVKPVPAEVLYAVVIFTAAFIAAVVFSAYKYYCPKASRKKGKKLLSLTLSLSVIVLSISGCSAKAAPKGSCINYSEHGYFTQNEKYAFILQEDGIYAINKSNGEKFNLPSDPFAEKMSLSGLYADKDRLYYIEEKEHWDQLKRIDCESFKCDTIHSTTDDKGSILGLGLGFGFVDNKGIMASVAFTNGIDWFFCAGHSVYKLNGGSFDIVLNEEVCYSKFAFDGRRIFYIGSGYELLCYDTLTKEKHSVCGDFVKTLYTDGEKLLYSSEKGIFIMDIETGEAEKLSDKTAVSLSYSKGITVFSDENSVYYLGDQPIEIYSGLQHGFGIIAETKQAWVRKSDMITMENEDLFIDIPN